MGTVMDGREATAGPRPGSTDQPYSLQEDDCPQFLDPSPLVIPMNYETEVTFQGKNLDTVKVGAAWGWADQGR